MTLKDRLQAEVKPALLAGDKLRVGTLRMALAAIKQREVDERITLDDGQSMAVLEKLIKQRREAAQQYRAGSREELAAKEEAEIQILSEFLPAALSEAELEELIRQALAETGAASPRDMGKAMTWLRERAAGRVDMAAVSARIKTLLRN